MRVVPGGRRRGRSRGRFVPHYITPLETSRAPVKVIQSPRHSTPVPTLGTYSDAGIGDQTAALGALPGPAAPAHVVPLATAPDAGAEGGPISEPLSLHFPNSGDGSGRITADDG